MAYRGREATIEYFEGTHSASEDFRLVRVNGHQSGYTFTLE
jgi:hypothetical protein